MKSFKIDTTNPIVREAVYNRLIELGFRIGKSKTKYKNLEEYKQRIKAENFYPFEEYNCLIYNHVNYPLCIRSCHQDKLDILDCPILPLDTLFSPNFKAPDEEIEIKLSDFATAKVNKEGVFITQGHIRDSGIAFIGFTASEIKEIYEAVKKIEE